ncbi:hypothetical protein TWF281_000309 [Arthrobotrys megalospora]
MNNPRNPNDEQYDQLSRGASSHRPIDPTYWESLLSHTESPIVAWDIAQQGTISPAQVRLLSQACAPPPSACSGDSTIVLSPEEQPEEHPEEHPEETVGEPPEKMAPPESLDSVGGDLEGLQLSEGRASGTRSAAQKRKRPENEIQRVSPENTKIDSPPKEIANPPESDTSEEGPRNGQFTVHSELTGGGLLRAQLARIREILEALRETFGKLPRHRVDAFLKDILEDMQKFQTYDIESEGVIGFVGEIGAGKSTLLNALLDMKDFVPTTDEGYCAPIIIEFAKSTPAHPPFSLQVHYITKSKLDEEAKLLFDEVYFGQDESPKKPQKPTTREGKAISQRFEFLFPNVKLDSLSTARVWIHKLYTQHRSLQEGKGFFHYTTQEACAAQLRNIVLSPGTEKSNVAEKWPIVERVRVFLDSKILNTGAILADIPGIDDFNTRVSTMQEYLAKVQEIVIVAPLDNIFVDDVDTLEKIGYEGVTAMDGRSRGTIVTTHLDEYTPDKAKGWFKKNKPFKEKFDELSADLKHAKTQLAHASRGNRQNDKEEMQANVQRRETKVARLCTSILGDYIEPQATEAFGRTIQSDDITWKVFAVDPIGYIESKKNSTFLIRAHDNKNLRRLVHLQEYIGAMTYPRQYRLAQRRFKEAQSIIANLLFWSTNEGRIPAGAQEKLSKGLKRALVNLETDLGLDRKVIAKNVTDALNHLYCQTEIVTYEATEKAQSLITEATYALTTMKLICRGGGEIEGSIDLNSKLLATITESLNEPWKEVTDYIIKTMNNFQTKFFESIVTMEGLFERTLNEQKMDPTVQAAIRNLVTKELQNARGHVVEICRNNVRKIHNMFRHGSRNFLRPESLKGQGAKRIITETISEQIEAERVFEKLGAVILAEIEEIDKFTHASMDQCCTKVMERMKGKLGHLILDRSERAGKFRKDPKYKLDLVKEILKTPYPEVEAIINSFESLSPGSIAEYRKMMAK